MEATKQRIRNFFKFFEVYGLWIAIGFAVAVAVKGLSGIRQNACARDGLKRPRPGE